MATRLPPEYVPAEERPARIAELERQVAREWVRFAIIDGAYLAIVVSIVVAFVLTDRVPETGQGVLAVVLATPTGALALYWIKVRIPPLQRELEELKRREAAT